MFFVHSVKQTLVSCIKSATLYCSVMEQMKSEWEGGMWTAGDLVVWCAWQNLNDQAAKRGPVYAINAKIRESDITEPMSQVGFLKDEDLILTIKQR